MSARIPAIISIMRSQPSEVPRETPPASTDKRTMNAFSRTMQDHCKDPFFRILDPEVINLCRGEFPREASS